MALLLNQSSFEIPPDLAIEVDITHSSLDRLEIYARLRVPDETQGESDCLRRFLAWIQSLRSTG